MSVKTVLVTGASGFLGWHVSRAALEAGATVIGTVRTHTRVPHGVRAQQCDLSTDGAAARLVRQARPSMVIHCAAEARPNACERDPDTSSRINVHATHALAEACTHHGVRMVFTSTDLVFDGASPPYVESDPACPVNAYGRQKAAAEREVLQADPAHVVCRMPLMYGAPSPSSGSFVQPWLEALGRGEVLSLFTDEYRCAVSVDDAAAGLLRAGEAGSGLYHLGGPEPMSRHAFGLLLAEVFGLDAGPIRAVRQAEAPMAAPRPADLTLDSSRARADLGYAPSLACEALSVLREQVRSSTGGR